MGNLKDLGSSFGNYVPNQQKEISGSLHEIRIGLDIVEGVIQRLDYPIGVRGIVAYNLSNIAKLMRELEDLAKAGEEAGKNSGLLELPRY